MGIQLSEDEESSPEPPAFVGLFDPALFKSLLHKASTSAKIGPDQEAQSGPSTSQDTSLLFSEPIVTQKHIPCHPLFLNTIQKQWGTPGTLPTLGRTDKRLFNVAPALSEALEVPVVDEPLTPPFSSFMVSGDMAETMKAQDRKSKLSFRKTHQALAWAVKTATSTSFFA